MTGNLPLSDGDQKLLCRSHDTPRYEHFVLTIGPNERGSDLWRVTMECGVRLIATIEGDELSAILRSLHAASVESVRQWMGLEVLSRWEKAHRGARGEEGRDGSGE